MSVEELSALASVLQFEHKGRQKKYNTNPGEDENDHISLMVYPFGSSLQSFA